MKISDTLKKIGISILVLMIASILGFVVWAKTGTMSSKEIAAKALITTDTVSITQNKWIVFEPVTETKIGLIFYPGGLVDAKAYAPILHKISESGVLVIITPMPLNLAIFNTNAANDVIEGYPNISQWIIAGHSLGGAAAAIFAENHPERIDAIALWDSYPPDSSDLSDNAIAAISIFGTMKGNPNTEYLVEKKHLLPSTSIFIGIEGANHAQFGDYGIQKGDVQATISIDEQHQQVAEIMIDFIANFRP